MAKTLVTDELWAVVEPLLPPESPKPKGGRPRINARAVLAGILFVVPQKMSLQSKGILLVGYLLLAGFYFFRAYRAYRGRSS